MDDSMQSKNDPAFDVGKVSVAPRSPDKRSADEHLTGNRLARFSCGFLTGEELAEAKRHVESCPDCASALEGLLDRTKVWQGESGRERLDVLRTSILGDEVAEILGGIALALTRASGPDSAVDKLR